MRNRASRGAYGSGGQFSSGTKRVLVIGRTGFIGSQVIHRLVESGHTVTVYHRGQTEAALPDSLRHVHRPEAAMPVCVYPDELFDPPPHIVIHIIAMGEEDSPAAVGSVPGSRSAKRRPDARFPV